MSYVERYHTPVRHAYKVIRSEAPDSTATDEGLQNRHAGALHVYGGAALLPRHDTRCQ